MGLTSIADVSRNLDEYNKALQNHWEMFAALIDELVPIWAEHGRTLVTVDEGHGPWETRRARIQARIDLAKADWAAYNSTFDVLGRYLDRSNHYIEAGGRWTFKHGRWKEF